jgi:hypothetical protein
MVSKFQKVNSVRRGDPGFGQIRINKIDRPFARDGDRVSPVVRMIMEGKWHCHHFNVSLHHVHTFLARVTKINGI